MDKRKTPLWLPHEKPVLLQAPPDYNGCAGHKKHILVAL